MSILDKAKAVAKAVPLKHSQAEEEAEAAPQADQRKIEDVLETLQIPTTFEIPGDVFMPEDLNNVNFSVQVPSGYDTGQVTKFVTQSRSSIRYLVELLRLRNEHIAKLATTIDRLQVDTNNLRFEAEIANGVSVMPTQTDADSDNQLMEARLTIRRLEDQLRTKPAVEAAGLSSGEREAYENLMDELSVAQRQVSALTEDNFHLKSRLAQLEDMEDDELDSSPAEAPLTQAEYEELGITMAEEPALPGVSNRSSWPGGLRLPAPDDSEVSTLEDDEVPLTLPGVARREPSHGSVEAFRQQALEDEDDDDLLDSLPVARPRE